MRSKLLVDTSSEKSWVIVFDTSEEAVAGLLSFAREQSITAAHFTAIGAFSSAVLGYFDWQTKQYNRIRVDEQVEVVTLMGDIALEKNEPKVHAHTALAKHGGVTVGGHLLEGYVRPTLEVVLNQAPKHLERKFDEKSGIALIRI
ncbi:MAG TPA: PPC domain-containing DNA-binding protein [Bryobacteraceae bacterium]|nr:PPC domain-containing DNA-binding protein [Bryobacteraceae bacterium]